MTICEQANQRSSRERQMEDRIEELEGLLSMSQGREAVVSEQLSRLEQKSSRLEEERLGRLGVIVI